jgi:hypothetical protein
VDAPQVWRLELEAAVETTGSMIRGIVRGRNHTATILRFGVPGVPCAVTLSLYADGAEVWDQGNIDRVGGCKWFPRDVELHPGEAFEVTTELTAPTAILGDSLTPGSYAARIRLIFARTVPHPEGAGALTTQVDTVMSLDAGTLRLHH